NLCLNQDFISEQAFKNRLFLKEKMEKFNFKNYSKEWWHYSYIPLENATQAYDFEI
ncbi:MAG: hypothetical protein K2X39_00495, partial [Silvanigrellaceae bacterium]|nr:hypothetical protein [Silvanigrellaceae bacterium]